MINFKLAEIATFIAVAELGSFRAAATKLNVSQSTVSVRVRQLEESLGIRLFQRSTRQVVLTSGGSRLLDAARDALGELEKLSRQLREEGELKQGRVALTALPTVAASLLPRVLLAFHKRYPMVEVTAIDCTADRALALVLAGDVDVALVSEPANRRDLTFNRLLRDECLVIVPTGHPAAAWEAITLEDLADAPLMVPARGSGFRATIEAAFAANGRTFSPAREAQNITTLIAYVEMGMGFSFVPSIFAHKLDASRCRTLRIGPVPIFRDIGTVTAAERPVTPAARAFIDFLRRQAPGLVDQGNAPAPEPASV
ncbi:LysR family transcriptional regulator [Acuticoccus kandeliae]|uniref:LysR family transcriptional regulator n=1 Tax=Acuticoccus kandeliae TaxID=2073160 RepID=UPI001472DBF8|nr:LysR family transcriptional regulator [Acuticoccus kandeliae]